MTTFETEAQHLRGIIQSASRMLEDAGYVAVSLPDAIGCVLADAKRVEECERELARARDEIQQLRTELDETEDMPF